MTTTADTNDLYELLRNAKIFASDAISLELSLSQDGVPHKALGDSMTMHLHEEGPDLTIYLPRGNTDQQYAFNKHLPERLLQWLMTEKDSQIPQEVSDQAVIAMMSVWNTPLAKLPGALSDRGIIEIDTPNIDPIIEESSSDSESDIGSRNPAGDWAGSASATQINDGNLDSRSEVVHTPPSAPDTPQNDFEVTHTSSSSSPSIRHGEPISLPTRLATPDSAATQSNPEYVNVLESVIASAATSTIPGRYEEGTRRNPRTSAWRGASRIRGETQFETDCKIGAAGELFVSSWHSESLNDLAKKLLERYSSYSPVWTLHFPTSPGTTGRVPFGATLGCTQPTQA